MIVSKKVKIMKCYINCISKGKTTIQENSHGVKYKDIKSLSKKKDYFIII